ncbi:pH-response regulator protein palA/RIM20, putative [Entamoeba invadens IP1]|uniref:pH-response regulator protein palA/RIM20, putative n=1 Tax=Entamoeba invadens IP1 TaxID=370355 RepID=A0A0A1U8E4_ENTIV|nr:pH-response regulator protein palA/RIM20, putative [Entamoeba invadens IP1]ELP89326.1 pH-response regulator protein palA/RIM20, putative [Entamoeba invadens IP1]|eukprot:XP_004256097.1 pH-response regulator protein palA/RIM20, putative [Entamoeba invadens IP1]
MQVTTLPIFSQGELYTADPVDFSPLHQEISQSSGDSIAKQAIDRLSELHKSFESSSSCSIESLLEYDSLLTHLSRALHDTLTLTFRWNIPIYTSKKTGTLFITKTTTTLNYDQVASSSISFEKAHVLYNAGILLFRVASSQASAQSSIPEAIKTFSQASGIFSETVSLADKCGLSREAEDARKYQALSRGCAQLAFYLKALAANSSVVLREKIIGGAVELLQSFKGGKSTESGGKNNERALYVYAYFLARVAAGMVAEEDVEYGVAIAQYSEGVKEIKETSLANETYVKEVKDKLNSLKKDNEEIYMSKIPEVVPALQSRVCVSDVSYELQIEESPFKSIVPPQLRNALNKYKSESSKIVSDTKTMIPNFTQQGDEVVQGINLRSLETKVENMKNMPNSLKIVVAKVKNCGTPEDALKMLDTVNERIKKIRSMMDEIDDVITHETGEENKKRSEYKDLWKRQVSEVYWQEIVRKMNVIKSAVDDAKLVYNNGKSEVLKTKNEVSVMVAGEEAILKNIPATEGDKLKEMVLQMTELFDRWALLKVAREKLVNGVIELESTHQKGLLESIKSTGDPDLFVMNLLKEFSEKTGEVQTSLNEQANLIGEIQQLNGEIGKFVSSALDTRGAVFVEYQKSGESFVDVYNKIVEKGVFMENVEEDAESLKREAKKCGEARKRESEEVEEHAKEERKRIEEENKKIEELGKKMLEANLMSQRKEEEQGKGETQYQMMQGQGREEHLYANASGQAQGNVGQGQNVGMQNQSAGGIQQQQNLNPYLSQYPTSAAQQFDSNSLQNQQQGNAGQQQQNSEYLSQYPSSTGNANQMPVNATQQQAPQYQSQYPTSTANPQMSPQMDPNMMTQSYAPQYNPYQNSMQQNNFVMGPPGVPTMPGMYGTAPGYANAQYPGQQTPVGVLPPPGMPYGGMPNGYGAQQYPTPYGGYTMF